MLKKTRAIALSYVKYRDTSIISRIYTERYGLQSYIVNGARSARAKSKMAFFQPLTLLELVAYHKENTHLHRISELRCTHPYRSIPFEIRKTTIGIFLSEVLGKIIRENDPNHAGQFEFVAASLAEFDAMVGHYESFHLQFLVKLTTYLGFDLADADELYLQVQHLTRNHSLADEVTAYLHHLYHEPYQSHSRTPLEVRREALSHLLSFYDHHLGQVSSLKSVEVLKQVL